MHCLTKCLLGIKPGRGRCLILLAIVKAAIIVGLLSLIVFFLDITSRDEKLGGLNEQPAAPDGISEMRNERALLQATSPDAQRRPFAYAGACRGKAPENNTKDPSSFRRPIDCGEDAFVVFVSKDTPPHNTSTLTIGTR